MRGVNRVKADTPWVSYAGITLSGISGMCRKRTIEACPGCGQAVEMAYARDGGGRAWLRVECPDCGYVSAAVCPV